MDSFMTFTPHKRQLFNYFHQIKGNESNHMYHVWETRATD